MSIQDIIKAIQSFGVTQEDIAAVGEISQATVSRLASGKHVDTSFSTATKLQAYLEKLQRQEVA